MADVRIRRDDARAGSAVLHVDGELDWTTAPLLQAHLSELIDAGERWFVVDLCQVAYLDSSALAVLARSFRQLGSEGAIAVVCRPYVCEILELTGLHSLFGTHLTREEAFAALEQRRREAA